MSKRRSQITIEGETYLHSSVLEAAEADRDPEGDPDYSPAYQDEYQRLWHEASARAQAAEADRDRQQEKYDVLLDATKNHRCDDRYRNALEQTRAALIALRGLGDCYCEAGAHREYRPHSDACEQARAALADTETAK